MKFNLNQLTKAMTAMHSNVQSYDNRHPDAVVELEIIEENPGDGLFLSHLALKCTVTEAATAYSPEKAVTRVIEVFSNEEKRSARMSTSETKDITD
jgi:hypothetical protein